MKLMDNFSKVEWIRSRHLIDTTRQMKKIAVKKYAAGASILPFPCHTDHNIDESFLFIDFPRFKIAKIAA